MSSRSINCHGYIQDLQIPDKTTTISDKGNQWRVHQGDDSQSVLSASMFNCT